MTRDGTEMIEDRIIQRLHRLGGDTLLARMIDLFLENAPARLEAIRAGTRDGEVGAVEQGAHSLKGTAGNLGATALQRIAEDIEQEAQAARQDRLPELVRALEGEYGRVVLALRERRRAL